MSEKEIIRNILIIDDQIGEVGSLFQKTFIRNYENLPFLFMFESCFDNNGYNSDQAISAISGISEIDLVLLDLKFGSDELFGFEILKKIASRYIDLPVLIMSSMQRDIEALGRCLEEGAVGFIEKHRSSAYLKNAIEQAIKLKKSHVLLGDSRPLRELRRQAARLSPYDNIPVMIVGERGTGKERVARYIWQAGPRSQGPFVAVNCGSIPEGLFESEFYGSEKGSFTGSVSRKIGYLEKAHGGILFLDEIGNMPLTMQAKLLRVTQEKEFNRLGGLEEEVKINIQIISATNIEPQRLMEENRLREDLYDRIAAVTINTPPLRSCVEDIPLLAKHFLFQLVGENKTISIDAIKAFESYSWPGNVRELQRIIQEAVVRSEDGSIITIEHLNEKVLCSNNLKNANPNNPAIKPEIETKITARDIWIQQLKQLNNAKLAIKSYKKKAWKAEFMRELFPFSKAPNSKGFNDLMKRLKSGPWGNPNWKNDPEMKRMIEDLEKT